jgi:hypothetical protein
MHFKAQDCQPDLEFVAGWLRECLGTHDCAPSQIEFKPTRLLEIGTSPSGSQIARLVESRERSGPYAALSHCWGKHQPLRTTKESHGSHFTGIAVKSLPKLSKMP